MASPVAITLYAVVSVWLLLLVAIAVDRYLHERRARRMAAARKSLLQSPVSDAAVLREIVGRLTLVELDAMISDGLPPTMEFAVAQAVTARYADLVRVAAGGANIWQRIAAARVLAASHAEKRYELLDRMLRSGTPALAAAAIRILAKINDRRSADLLTKALRAGVYSRSRIAAAIDVMSVPRADLLKTLFDAEEAQVRFWGAKLAGRLQARQWTARVRQLMTDPDALVRRAAVEAFGIIGTADDCHVLEARLKDPVGFVRAHAARAYARLTGSPDIEVPANVG